MSSISAIIAAQPQRRLQVICSQVTAAVAPVAVDEVQSKLSHDEVLKTACRDANARVAVYWEFDSLTQKLRIAGYHKNLQALSKGDQSAVDMLCHEASLQAEVEKGFGALGRVYDTQKSLSFDNMMKLPHEGFMHNYLADRMGVKWVGLRPFLNGVLEVGAPERTSAQRPQQLLSNQVSSTSAHVVKGNDAYDSTTPKDLLKIACLEENARLVAYWEFDVLTQRLRVTSFHNHIPAMSEKDSKSLELLCGEASRYAQVSSGEGAVGTVHKNQQASRFENMMKLPSECFIHNYLADKAGVKYVTMRPFLNGVLEIGSAEPQQTL